MDQADQWYAKINLEHFIYNVPTDIKSHNRLQVVREAQSTRVGPDGMRETRRVYEDGRRGIRQTATGHHIGERGRVCETERDLQGNVTEEREDLLNLDEGSF